MAMIAMQLNANQQQQQTQLGQAPQNPTLGNIVQQLLIAQTMGAAQNGFAMPAQQMPPYLNDSMFSVNSIRRVMDEGEQFDLTFFDNPFFRTPTVLVTNARSWRFGRVARLSYNGS